MLSTYSSPFVLSLLLLLSLPILFLLGPRILTPKTLPAIPDPDEIDDLALFRRATLAADAGSGGGDGGGAVAASLRRRPAAQPKGPRAPLQRVRPRRPLVPAPPPPHALVPPPLHPGQGHPARLPTLISAARRLLAAALLDDPANAFFALVSQHCVPLRPFPSLYRALLSDPPAAAAAAGRRRHHRSFIEILSGEPGLWDRYVARGDAVMLPEVPFQRFRVGSQFFVLARRHAMLVVRDRRLWKKFRLPCLRSMKDSCYPEEHYFPTLLDMQDPQGCTRYTLTRVNWTDSVGGHPHTYRPWEISGDLIRELRRSNSTYSYMFARKFSPDCLDPLLAIADSVIFRD
uniref:Uncharacterized protein n=1 Tax=Ananas comosus var. bracteatus TaxID=296719 RepID=A0A6V7PBX6_ANACO|nr:unnamed protein product [Ananas comosus var. bracteatus]